jgi:hypothetical protein
VADFQRQKITKESVVPAMPSPAGLDGLTLSGGTGILVLGFRWLTAGIFRALDKSLRVQGVRGRLELFRVSVRLAHFILSSG